VSMLSIVDRGVGERNGVPSLVSAVATDFRRTLVLVADIQLDSRPVLRGDPPGLVQALGSMSASHFGSSQHPRLRATQPKRRRSGNWLPICSFAVQERHLNPRPSITQSSHARNVWPQLHRTSTVEALPLPHCGHLKWQRTKERPCVAACGDDKSASSIH
jgi:hypothetical protein